MHKKESKYPCISVTLILHDKKKCSKHEKKTHYQPHDKLGAVLGASLEGSVSGDVIHVA